MFARPLLALALRVMCRGALVLLLQAQIIAAALPVVPAFPGAEGAGALTPGGRGGRVLAVTNLADDGPGSFRNAVEAAGPRVIVFRVSGIIDLRSDIVVRNSRLTIAGQSAPGDGICLRGRSLRIEGAEDIVVRYLRIRPGAGAGVPLDGIEVRNSRNVIIDHCSISWTVDEALNTWHGVENLTVQWCLIAEPLHRAVDEAADRAHSSLADTGRPARAAQLPDLRVCQSRGRLGDRGLAGRSRVSWPGRNRTAASGRRSAPDMRARIGSVAACRAG
jgi:hypothetical protein